MYRFISPERAGISSQHILEFLKTLEHYNFCTHSFIMARGRDIFSEGYYAPFHKDFQHRMYSVSKSFVSVAVGLAVQDGLLSLDDKFVKFFPEYLNDNTNEKLKSMTIRQMLTMETSQTDHVGFFTSKTKDRCEVYFRKSASRVPGTVWEYDSPGSFMLCAIVEKLTGMPFLEYLKERFLLRAGFSEEAYCLQCPGGYSFADSGVMCTARDLLVFARFVMDGGKIDGIRYMNEEYLAEATKKQVSNSHGGEISYESYGYGYLIWKAPNDGFAFIGMGDQIAVCDREKDFIFIITSDNQGRSPHTLMLLYHELYKSIIQHLGEPLEEDEKAYKELMQYVAGLKLFSLRESVQSPWASQINGKTYQLEPNPMGIEYVHFALEENKGLLTYKNAQGVKKLPFGFGYNELCKFPQTNYPDIMASVPVEGHMYDCAVSADWPEESKLRIKVQIIDKYLGNMSMEFGFIGEEVGVYMHKDAQAFLEEYQGHACGYLVKDKEV